VSSDIRPIPTSINVLGEFFLGDRLAGLDVRGLGGEHLGLGEHLGVNDSLALDDLAGREVAVFLRLNQSVFIDGLAEVSLSMSLFQAKQQWSRMSSWDSKTRFESQLSRMNCQMFSDAELEQLQARQLLLPVVAPNVSLFLRPHLAGSGGRSEPRA
jgi:hypothetical protein